MVHPLPIDSAQVEECRSLADQVAGGVHRFIDAHTTTSIERTVLRAYAVDGANADGAPLVNTCIDRYLAAGLLDRGIASYLGGALVRGAEDPQQAAEELAYGPLPAVEQAGGPDLEQAGRALARHTALALERLDRARRRRESDRER